MSINTALADARQIRRVRAAQGAVWRRYFEATVKERVQGAPRRWTRWLQIPIGLSFPAAPLLIPLFTWFATREDAGLWRFLAFALAMVFRGELFQSRALEFTAADVLRAPSKAGLLFLRLYAQVPQFLFMAFCLALAYAIALGDAILEAPARCCLLLAAVALTPVAHAIGKLRARLVSGGASVLGPLLVPTLVGICVRSELENPLDAGRIAVCAVLAAIGIAALVRITHDVIKEPRRHLRVLPVELTMLPYVVVALGLLLPTPLLRNAVAVDWLPGCALAVVALLLAFSLPRLATEVRHAEESTPGSAVQRADRDTPRRDEPVSARMPASFAGRRSLMRAQLYLHRRHSWFRPGELAGPVQVARRFLPILFLLLHHAWGPLLAALAVARTTPSNVQVTLALLAGLTAPALVSFAPTWRLHRLGVDFLEQARHNVRALVLIAALPALLAAGVVGTLCGWTSNRGLVVAILAMALACRAGWRGFARDSHPEHRSSGAVLTGIGVLTLSPWLPSPPWWAVLIALGTGVVGVLLRMCRMNETTLASAMRAEDELTGGP